MTNLSLLSIIISLYTLIVYKKKLRSVKKTKVNRLFMFEINITFILIMVMVQKSVDLPDTW